MNVEAIVVQYLKTQTSWAVSGEVPSPLPDKFITVERTRGGREAFVLDMAEVMISVYHKTSKLDAANMADDVADVIPGIVEDYEDVTRSKVNSVVQLDDTTRGYRRYLVYADIFNRR